MIVILKNNPNLCYNMTTHNLINEDENQDLVQPYIGEPEQLQDEPSIEEDEDDVLTEEKEEDYL